MGRAERTERPEAEAFARMRLRMRALDDAAPPHLDPRALAMRAVLVTDRLGQTDLLRRVDALGRAGACDPRSVDDLRMAARALMHALSKRDDGVETGDAARASVLRAEALRIKRAGLEALDVLDSDEARLWLDVLRLPAEDIELVFDLRSMARLYEEHRDALGDALEPSASARAARSAADALERGLSPAADAEWDPWIARGFALTLSLYAEVCRIGQFLRGTDGLALGFPSPAGVARAARRNRGPTSSTHAVRRGPPPLPASAPEAASVPEAVSVPEAEPASSPASFRRRSGRLSAELEVSLFSDSNFYVGFTENLSEGGLFVATYLMRPLGSKVEMSVRLPGRAEPLILRGEVRWVREYSPTSDGCPGMGIQFDGVSESDHSDIAAFLATREPLFFTD